VRQLVPLPLVLAHLSCLIAQQATGSQGSDGAEGLNLPTAVL